MLLLKWLWKGFSNMKNSRYRMQKTPLGTMWLGWWMYSNSQHCMQRHDTNLICNKNTHFKSTSSSCALSQMGILMFIAIRYPFGAGQNLSIIALGTVWLGDSFIILPSQKFKKIFFSNFVVLVYMYMYNKNKTKNIKM